MGNLIVNKEIALLQEKLSELESKLNQDSDLNMKDHEKLQKLEKIKLSNTKKNYILGI